MKEAIEEMSAQGARHDHGGGRGRAGSSGVITDGDLRRQQLAHGAALLERRGGRSA